MNKIWIHCHYNVSVMLFFIIISFSCSKGKTFCQDNNRGLKASYLAKKVTFGSYPLEEEVSNIFIFPDRLDELLPKEFCQNLLYAEYSKDSTRVDINLEIPVYYLGDVNIENKLFSLFKHVVNDYTSHFILKSHATNKQYIIRKDIIDGGGGSVLLFKNYLLFIESEFYDLFVEEQEPVLDYFVKVGVVDSEGDIVILEADASERILVDFLEL